MGARDYLHSDDRVESPGERVLTCPEILESREEHISRRLSPTDHNFLVFMPRSKLFTFLLAFVIFFLLFNLPVWSSTCSTRRCATQSRPGRTLSGKTISPPPSSPRIISLLSIYEMLFLNYSRSLFMLGALRAVRKERVGKTIPS